MINRNSVLPFLLVLALSACSSPKGGIPEQPAIPAPPAASSLTSTLGLTTVGRPLKGLDAGSLNGWPQERIEAYLGKPTLEQDGADGHTIIYVDAFCRQAGVPGNSQADGVGISYRYTYKDGDMRQWAVAAVVLPEILALKAKGIGHCDPYR